MRGCDLMPQGFARSAIVSAGLFCRYIAPARAAVIGIVPGISHDEGVRVNLIKMLAAQAAVLALWAVSAQATTTDDAIAKRLEPVGKVCVQGKECEASARRGSRRWRRCAFRRHRRQDLQHLPRHRPAGRAEGWRQGRVGQARQEQGGLDGLLAKAISVSTPCRRKAPRRLLGRRAESRDQAYVRSVTTPERVAKSRLLAAFSSAVRVFPAGGSSRRQTGSKLPATHSPEGIVLSRTCSIDAAVDHLLQTIEGPIRMACPRLGKPNRLVNALYQRLRTLPERQRR